MSIAELPLFPVIETPVPDDDQHLAAYESKLQLVRDYTRGVALGFSNGFFLYGTGGIAKSYTVLGELQRLGKDFKLFNSRMSGRGLFEALAEYPATIHVLEDMERLVKDKDGQGIIRSACWAQRGEDGRQKRTITWATAKGVEQIVFSGGIIMLSNRPLDDLPELRAIKTRISHLHLEVTDAEIAAQMRRLAKDGYQHDGAEMTPDEAETRTRLPHGIPRTRLEDLRFVSTALKEKIVVGFPDQRQRVVDRLFLGLLAKTEESQPYEPP